MISFSSWYLRSGEGICLAFVLGVTAIAVRSHGGDIHLADKSGSVKEPVVINLVLRRGGDLPVHGQYRRLLGRSSLYERVCR